jgi:hypothetical protein
LVACDEQFYFEPFGSEFRAELLTAEGCYFFVTYQWGKPQLQALARRMRRGKGSPIDKLLERIPPQARNQRKCPASLGK